MPYRLGGKEIKLDDYSEYLVIWEYTDDTVPKWKLISSVWSNIRTGRETLQTVLLLSNQLSLEIVFVLFSKMNFVRTLAMKTTFKKMKTSFRNKLNPRKIRAKMKGRAFKDLQAASRFSVCSSKKLKTASQKLYLRPG